jgi:hypothetical protein
MKHCCCFNSIIKNPKLCITNFKKNPCCSQLVYTLSKPIIPTKNNNANNNIIDNNHIYIPFTYRINANGSTMTEIQKLQLLNNTNGIKMILTNYNDKINNIMSMLKNNQGGGQYIAFFKLVLLEYNEVSETFEKISMNWFRFIISFSTTDSIDNESILDILTTNLTNYVNTIQNKKIYSLLHIDIDGLSGFRAPFSFSDSDIINYDLKFSNLDSDNIFMDEIPGEIITTKNINFNTQRDIPNEYNYQTVYIPGIISNVLSPNGLTIFANSGDIYVGPGDGLGNWLKTDLDNVSKNILINNNFINMYYYNLTGSTLSEITTEPKFIQFKGVEL